MEDKYNQYLSEYVYEIADSICGETVIWGRKINNNCPEDIYEEICKKLPLHYSYPTPNTMVITKVLTRQEAIDKYGEITEEEYGSRGGWESVTFGNKKFKSKFMKQKSEESCSA